MAEQLKLPFDEVPISCPVQERYHAIAPLLAEKISPDKQAEVLHLSYSTIMRWLRQFREDGMAGLFDKPGTRQPYTPERVIVSLLYFKCCAPKASDFELAKVVSTVSGHHLHNETVKALLERYFFWRYREFQTGIFYPVPTQLHERRIEMVKLKAQGWSEKTIAFLLKCSRNSVSKWLRRYKSPLKQNLSPQELLYEHSRRPLRTRRKVYFGTMRAVLELQKKYGYAGWFRIQGYLERDYEIKLGETTIKKIMQLNRRLHLAPQRRVEVMVKESKEGPLKSARPFEHVFVDFRYLDAKPKGIQLYSCLLIEGYSRTILAGSLTRTQDTGVLLRIYYLGLLEFGVWAIVVSDNGGQFVSHAFDRVNRRLQIYHHKNDKGHPWQNLIESQFGIQARIGEYGWERCHTVEEAIDLHRQLVHDHNRLPHFAHRCRQDNKHSPLEVLAYAHGREIDKADLHRAFSRKCWQRKTDERGFVRVNHWEIYVEAGLPKTPIQVTYWDKKLRAEYDANLLVEYNCKWDNLNQRPKAISHPQFFETPFQSPQLPLFDPYWLRSAIEVQSPEPSSQKSLAVGQRLKLYFRPEIVK
jgi:putative transposase